MSTTDTELEQLIINVGTSEEIQAAIQAGTITENMLSVATDDDTFITKDDVKSTYSSTGTDPVNGTAVASAISGKQATITGAATTITSSDLTENRALISNNSGKVAVSSVTSTELGYVSGVTSAIQTQLNAKAAYPSQSGNSGKFLTTNGSAVSWADVDALPSQSGNNGKFLKTNGSAASWETAISSITYDSTTETLTFA